MNQIQTNQMKLNQKFMVKIKFNQNVDLKNDLLIMNELI